jgi:hypothetical protein
MDTRSKAVVCTKFEDLAARPEDPAQPEEAPNHNLSHVTSRVATARRRFKGRGHRQKEAANITSSTGPSDSVQGGGGGTSDRAWRRSRQGRSKERPTWGIGAKIDSGAIYSGSTVDHPPAVVPVLVYKPAPESPFARPGPSTGCWPPTGRRQPGRDFLKNMAAHQEVRVTLWTRRASKARQSCRPRRPEAKHAGSRARSSRGFRWSCLWAVKEEIAPCGCQATLRVGSSAEPI